MYSRYDENGDSRETRVYNSSRKLQLVEFLKWTVLIFCILCLAGLFLLPTGGMNLRFCVIAAFLSLAVSAIRAFFWCRTRAEISLAGLSLFRSDRQYAFLPLDSDFTPRVMTKYHKSIPTGTVRGFSVPRGRRTRWIPCRCISAADFSCLTEDIRKLRRDRTFRPIDMTPLTEEIYTVSEDATFEIPRRELMRGEEKRLFSIVLGCFACGVVLALLWLIFVYPESFSAAALPYMLFISLVFPVTASLFHGGRLLAFTRKLPGRIILSASALRIDGRQFHAGEIRRISMTPVSCTSTRMGSSFRRRLDIDADGQNAQYHLGSTAGAQKNMLYADYEKLLKAVREWCLKNRVPFYEDMG